MTARNDDLNAMLIAFREAWLRARKDKSNVRVTNASEGALVMFAMTIKAGAAREGRDPAIGIVEGVRPDDQSSP